MVPVGSVLLTSPSCSGALVNSKQNLDAAFGPMHRVGIMCRSLWYKAAALAPEQIQEEYGIDAKPRSETSPDWWVWNSRLGGKVPPFPPVKIIAQAVTTRAAAEKAGVALFVAVRASAITSCTAATIKWDFDFTGYLTAGNQSVAQPCALQGVSNNSAYIAVYLSLIHI